MKPTPIDLASIPESVRPQFTDDDWRRLLGHRSCSSGTYARQNGDTMPQLPLAQHDAWTRKGWTLAEVNDPEATLG